VSELWDPVFGRSEVAAATSDRAWLQALCATEAALAAVCATYGLIPAEAAGPVADACRAVAEADPGALGRQAAVDGNPVIAVVAAVRAHVPEHASAVHHGATSQDILDTAAMLLARDASSLIVHSLEQIATSCIGLAAAYRSTPMVGRTLMQQAVPTTFGAMAATWGEGVDRALAALRGLEFCVSLGGAAGTLTGWHPHGNAVRADVAAVLKLHDPGTVWHAERSRIAAIAGALGLACGVLGKIAGDVVLLSQTEVAEVREDATGASSAMAHKQNPIAAITARAAAAQAPGLVATLLATMAGELQRAAGCWHAEWLPMTALLDTTAGAARRLATSLSGLHVHVEVMAAHLPPGAQEVGHAIDLADAYVGRQR
jgi:3-carboxy-cis,cis-muconate cycloisomerase